MSPADNVAALLGRDGAEFVRCAYLTLVKREPDETGLPFYYGRLLDGVSKVQILTEMHGSPEARSKGVHLPGLEREIFRRRLGMRRWIGPVLRTLLGIEGDSAAQVRLRRIEQHVIAIYREGSLGQGGGFGGRNPVLARRVGISTSDPAAVINQFREAVSGSDQAQILTPKHSG